MAFSRRTRTKSDNMWSEGRLEEANKTDDTTDDAVETGGEHTTDTFSLETLNIIKTIGTGTFARVCLCRHSNNRRSLLYCTVLHYTVICCISLHCTLMN